MFVLILFFLTLLSADCNDNICQSQDYSLNCPSDCLLLSTYIEDFNIDSSPFNIPIHLIGNVEYLGIEFSIEYDSNVLDFIGITLSNTIFENQSYSVTYNEVSPGTIDAAYFSAGELVSSSDAIIGNIVFNFSESIQPGLTSFININEMRINNFYIQCDSDDDTCLLEQNGSIVVGDCGANHPPCDCGVEFDVCGVCGGPGDIYDCGCYSLPVGACDCDGNTFDVCGVCGGPGDIYDCGCNALPVGACNCDGNILDCLGECGGSALEDQCGVCDNNMNNDCTQDCLGEWGGDAIEDECGVCNGMGLPVGVCDCNGNILDCLGVCGGSAIEDNCGVCNGDDVSCTGCTDPNANNFNQNAVIDSGCEYEFEIVIDQQTSTTGSESIDIQVQIEGNPLSITILPFTQFQFDGDESQDSAVVIGISSEELHDDLVFIDGQSLEFSMEPIVLTPNNLVVNPGIVINIDYTSNNIEDIRNHYNESTQYDLYRLDSDTGDWQWYDNCNEGVCSALINNFGTYAVLNTLLLDLDESSITNNLISNYPNPFNPMTTFHFEIKVPNLVDLSVYDIKGEIIEVLVSEYLPSGIHKFNWDASNNSSGIYIARLSSTNFNVTRKVLLLR